MSVVARLCQRCAQPLGLAADGTICPSCVLRTALAEDQPEPVEPQMPGRQFGDFDILEELGRGGMGVVYRARQGGLDRVVALKLLLAGPYSSPETLQRFRAEARAAAALQHPNIVALHEAGEVDGQPYLTMDFVAGQNLAELAKQTPFAPRRAAACLAKIASAVQYAHDRQVLHRDLKPSNIILDVDDRPHVTDFGLAKQSGGDDLTLTGQVLGSPGYVAPEQVSGAAPAGATADVYSLGAVLYYLVTTRAPFTAATTAETLRLVLEREPVRPRALNPTIPRDLETICLKCLDKDPTRRYSSARDLADELGRFLDGAPIVARPISDLAQTVRWARRHPAAAALIATVALALASTSAVFYATARRVEHARAEEHRARGIAEESLYASKILIAGTALNAYAPDLRSVRAELDSLRPAPGQRDMRGFEWRTLWLRSRGEEISQLRGHNHVVSFALFSPDGASVVTQSLDGEAKVWDVSSRREIHSLQNVAHIGGFTHEGQHLVFSQPDGSIWRLDVEVGATDRLLSRAGRLIGLASNGRDAIVLDGTGAPVLHPLDERTATAGPGIGNENAPAEVVAALSRDGRRVGLWGRGQPGIRVVDVLSGQTLASLPDLRPVVALALSPDGSQIVSAGFDGVLKIWDVDSGALTRDFKAFLDPIRGMDFSWDGRSFAAGGNNRLVKIWDVPAWEEKQTLRGHEDTIWSVAFGPNNRSLVTGGQEEIALLWTADTTRAPEELRQLLRGPAWTDRTPHLAFSADGRRFVATAADGTVKVWDTDTLQVIASLPGEARTVAFAANGQDVLTESYDGTMQQWNLARQELSAAVPSPITFKNWAMASLDPEERVGLVAERLAANGEPALSEIPSSRDHMVAGALNTGGTMIVSPQRDTVFFGLPNGFVEAWDLRTRTRRYHFSAHKLHVASLAVSPDGTLLASGSLDSTTKLWDAKTGQHVATYFSHNRPVWALAFSPDGQTIAAGSCDKAVILCSVPLRRVVLNLWLYQGVPLGYEQEVRLLRFSPDGNVLAVALGDGTLRLFRGTTLEESDRGAPLALQD
jgi:eukaryotic-like serine/threonine-protein kinase